MQNAEINAESIGSSCKCTNPVCRHITTDEERAGMLCTSADVVPGDIQLMPLREDDRGPIIRGRCRLDTDEARSLLVTPEEAARRIEQKGVRGFYVYADLADHGTDGLIFTDEDEPDRWPDLPDSLTVVSGSGEGQHRTWLDDGWDHGAEGKGDLQGVGGVRVINTGVVVPGSIHHDSDGIYHVVDNRSPVSLSPDDLPAELRPTSSDSLPSDETSHAPPETIDEEARSRMEEVIRGFYHDSRGEREVTKRARDMLTDLFRGRYRTNEGGMDRDVVQRFETTDDRGDDRECRHRAEKCLAGLLYGIIDRYGDRADREDAEQLIYHYITDACQKCPKTTEGRQRLWDYSERYRRTTVARAIEDFDREPFRRWRRRQYDDGPHFTGEYSVVTLETVMESIIDLSDDLGDYPTEHQYPTRSEIVALCQLKDDRAERTYAEALSRLVNRHRKVKRADLGDNCHIYYMEWRADPPEAIAIHPEE